MTDSQILALVAYISAHSAVMWKAMQWGFNRVLEYQMLVRDFADLKSLTTKLNNDLNAAFRKIEILEEKK